MKFICMLVGILLLNGTSQAQSKMNEYEKCRTHSGIWRGVCASEEGHENIALKLNGRVNRSNGRCSFLASILKDGQESFKLNLTMTKNPVAAEIPNFDKSTVSSQWHGPKGNWLVFNLKMYQNVVGVTAFLDSLFAANLTKDSKNREYLKMSLKTTTYKIFLGETQVDSRSRSHCQLYPDLSRS